MTEPGRRRPIEDEASAPFWAAAREGRLVVQQLADGTLRWPPSPAPMLAQPPDWREVSGRGTVWSYSVVVRSSHPAPPTPYVMAIVELEEGPFVFTNVVAVDPAAMSIGMPVEVDFEPLGDDRRLPVFRPS